MDQDKEIARLRALVEYAATSLESLGIMLVAAEQLRQAPLTELVDPIIEGAQSSANMLWSALADASSDNVVQHNEGPHRTLN